MKLKQFRGFNTEASESASRAFAELTGRDVAVKLGKFKTIRLAEGHAALSGEKKVTGIRMAITGQVRGAALLCFREPTAAALSALLVAPVAAHNGRSALLTESALKEAGNILCGNYLAVLSNRLRREILPGIPHYCVGRFASMFKRVLAELSEEEPETLLVEVEIDCGGKTMVGYLLLLFDVKSLLGG